ncbi:hypothetical protein DVE09_15820 [Salmonella enterica]|nr:hypothetical protein [Salmonella enterica]
MQANCNAIRSDFQAPHISSFSPYSRKQALLLLKKGGHQPNFKKKLMPPTLHTAMSRVPLATGSALSG